MIHHEATKDTKKKGKPAMRGWSCLKIFALVVGGFFLLVGMIQFLFWSGSVKPSLDAEYIPTAEYLLANPQSTSEGNSISLHIGDKICILVSIYDDNKALVTTYPISEIFINQQRVGLDDIEEHVSHSIISAVEAFCVENTLNTGLHIIEFRARGDWRQLLFSQQWAIEVE